MIPSNMRRRITRAVLGLLLGALLSTTGAATAGPALQATVEWTILAPSPPGPARTLLFDISTMGLGPIEHPDCGVWADATHTLTIYDTTTAPIAPGSCTPAVKVIRHTGPDAGTYALTWAEGAGPFFDYLLYPGDVLAVTPAADGGLRVQLP